MPISKRTPSASADPAAVLARAKNLRKFIVDLTLRICREKTVDYFEADYPQGGPDGMAMPGHEGKVVKILAAELKKLKIPYKTYAKVKGRENLLASVGKKKPGYKKLLVVLHTDVVPSGAPSDWKFAPFKPFEKNGKLYGRGVLDDKGPLASAFATLRILKEIEEHIPGEFIFGAVGDEEVGVGVGLDFLIKKKVIKCTDAIIPDIAGDMKEINIAEKGRVILKVQSHGKQAHAMEPKKGVNAVHAMAHFLTALEGHTLSHTPHPAFHDGPTINLGLVKGGVAPNAVAADCEVTLDIRFLPGQNAEAIRAEIQGLADSVQRSGATPGATFKVEIFQSVGPCEVKPDAPIVRMIQKHAPDAKLTGSGGGTFSKDLIHALGIESVGWSCGNEATYHQPNEEVEVDQLVTFSGRLANLALDLCSMKS
ncbi:MAG TPA: M20/M25/M40 family metallo-hydrolase [Verrucomicrobiae bacterium]|nr:M20/M25/M40 family metallo-hydrolase [Verrucomicrobiae bacterium]